MALNLALPEKQVDLKPRIVVLGVGGAGGNAVNTMIQSELQGVEFVVANTDAQALAQSLANSKIQLGTSETRGLGAGSKPDVGQAAAEESISEVLDAIADANLVFVAAGMGGGTGTGAAPVIAKAARERGILTVAVVTKPFRFEGAPRMRLAEKGIEALQSNVDTLITIPNQNLFRVANDRTTFADAFKMADDVLYEGVRGISDLMVQPGLINLDFADVRALMSVMGKAMMGLGEGEGECRAIEAAEAAIANPLLEDGTMRGAMGVLINIAGGPDLTLFEVDEAANRIREEVDPEANIIFGSSFDPVLQGRIRISVVATGIEAEAVAGLKPQRDGSQVDAVAGVSTEPTSTSAPASPVYAPRQAKFAEEAQAVPTPAMPLPQQTQSNDAAHSAVSPSPVAMPTAAQVGPTAVASAAPRDVAPQTVAPQTMAPQPLMAPVNPGVPPMPTPVAPPGMDQGINTSSLDHSYMAPQAEVQPVPQAADVTARYQSHQSMPNLTADQPSGQTSVPSNGFARSSGLFSRIQNFAKNSQQPFGLDEPLSKEADNISAHMGNDQNFGHSQTFVETPVETAAAFETSIGHEQASHHPAFDEDLLEIPAFLRRQAN